jgi:hypothetical protein
MRILWPWVCEEENIVPRRRDKLVASAVGGVIVGGVTFALLSVGYEVMEALS